MTLIQVDADTKTLEALSRDPHVHVRRVVAAHLGISEEVCFRLSEDQQASVLLALRKNPRCHPFIAAAVQIRDERSRPEELANADHLLEAAWQARRAGLSARDLVDLTREWTGVDADDLTKLTLEQVGLVLDVLSAKLGQGKLPAKPRRRKKTKAKKKKAKARSRSKRG